MRDTWKLELTYYQGDFFSLLLNHRILKKAVRLGHSWPVYLIYETQIIGVEGNVIPASPTNHKHQLLLVLQALLNILEAHLLLLVVSYKLN